MLDCETVLKLDDVAARLLRRADECTSVGEQAGALAASDTADAVLAVLDLNGARLRQGRIA